MRVYPKVDRYTELGALRSQSDMDREYQRLLARDRNPLSFLYGGMSQILSFMYYWEDCLLRSRFSEGLGNV